MRKGACLLYTSLGAEAVQVGTRFVVAKESNAHQNFKNKILKTKDIDTVDVYKRQS